MPVPAVAVAEYAEPPAPEEFAREFLDTLSLVFEEYRDFSGLRADWEEAARLGAGAGKIPDFQPGDTVVVNVKVTEGGENAIGGHGSWWLSKVGKVVKFEMMLNNWIVPMAGSDAITDVIIRGKAR